MRLLEPLLAKIEHLEDVSACHADVRLWHKADIPGYGDLCPLSGEKQKIGVLYNITAIAHHCAPDLICLNQSGVRLG
jgi:hypothetical protein